MNPYSVIFKLNSFKVQFNFEPLQFDFLRGEIPVIKESREVVETYPDPNDRPVVGNLVTVTMQTQSDKLYVYLNPVEQSINLGSVNISMVQQLGKRFDEEMAKGMYQEYFSRYE